MRDHAFLDILRAIRSADNVCTYTKINSAFNQRNQSKENNLHTAQTRFNDSEGNQKIFVILSNLL